MLVVLLVVTSTGANSPISGCIKGCRETFDISYRSCLGFENLLLPEKKVFCQRFCHILVAHCIRVCHQKNGLFPGL
ncbi:hypothetical protein NP493_1359g00043 [Ridgeia piscesae]|uniref:Uncharacterized protein n=1 Tax=Ridgeia piscesae TaxID=27915 RepID=A0AAD9ND20_RIDPI|nr:hypothetical protein NP493_1359g00043 [Ridgeia piscesae]